MHSFLLLLIAINCLSCDQKPESKQQPSQQQVSIQQQAPLKAGRVISAVPVRGQAGQSFAFYLPASYDSSNTYPLLIALDPHGKGSLPLEKYKTLADTFNIVMAGSNYSKNGMNFRQSLAHIHLLIQDIGTRIRVDTARLWCMGFSGGARVALNVGALNFGIDAVVLCGAGMPAEDTEEISRLHFIGLAGDADMNYPELYRLNKALNKQGGGNTLITFDGKHEWPPVEEMHSAFIWLQMDYYRRTGLNPPHTVLSKWIARDLSACDSIDNPANRALRYERMIACYSGFTDVFGWKTKKQQIERDPVTIAQRKRMAEIMLAEERAEKNFSEAFIRADLNWWQKQIARLRKTSGGTDVLAGKSAERQMAYIGLAAYSYTNRALSAGRLQDVDKFIRIYRLAEPGNPEHEYLSAVLRARQNRLPEALEFLQEAARLGFSDVQRLVGERDLAPLQTMEGFDGLISSMETNRSQ